MHYCIVCGHAVAEQVEVCTVCAVRTTFEQQRASRDGRRIATPRFDSDQ
jgi:hypothetical protein